MKKQIYIALMAVAAGMVSCSTDNDEPRASIPAIDNIPQLASYSLSRSEIEVEPKVVDFNFRLINTISDKYRDIYDNAPEGGNFAISPLSATVNIALLANSLDDAATADICNFIGTDDLPSLNTLCAKYMSMAAHTDDTFVLSNSVWYSDVFTPSPDYVQGMKESLFVDFRPMDLANSAQATNDINSWIARQTNNLIGRLLTPGDALSELYWINAMYFEGKWKNEFKVDDTAPATFTCEDGSKTQVDMMQSTFVTDYLSDGNIHGVTLPFKGNTSMTFLMPREEAPIADLSGKLDAGTWSRLNEKSRGLKLQVQLPRFRIDDALSLSQVYNLMGFDFGAVSLPKMGIEGSFGIVCDQKNCIEIDENGAKAASVTSSGLITSDGVTPTRITFDRPFVYLLTDNTTGAILMAGRVSYL